MDTGEDGLTTWGDGGGPFAHAEPSAPIPPLFVDLSQKYGGASVRSQALVMALAADGAGLATIGGGTVLAHAREAGIRVHATTGLKFSPAAVRGVARAIAHGGYRLVDTQNPISKLWGTVAAGRSGVAVVSTLNSWYRAEHGRALRGLLYHWIERVTTPRTDVFVAVSHDIAGKLRRCGVPDDAIAVVPNAVDLDVSAISCRPDALRAELGLSADTRLICAVGRLVSAKAYDVLLRAIATLREPRLCCVIVGGGGQDAKLRATIREAGLGSRVRLLGWRSHAETLRIMKAADLFVLSSRSEGTPIVLLEAAALGVPIVTTRVGGIPELVRDGEHALMVESERPEALAAAIAASLREPEVALERAERARRHIRAHFGIAGQAEATRIAHARAVARHARRIGADTEKT